MPPIKVLTAFRLDPAQLAALRAIKERDGIGTAEQVRRALALWFTHKGIKVAEARRPKRGK